MTRKTETPRAIGYVRVSTESQARDGISLDAQRAKIAAWCELTGYELVHTYEDAGISGASLKPRRGLEEARTAVRAMGGVLVFYSLSRLTRNTRDMLDLFEELQTAGVDLVSLSERIDTTSATGKMVFRMLAVLAEFERDLLRERICMGMERKRQKGEKTGGAVPYGLHVGVDGKTLEADETEQPLIDAIRTARQQGLSQRAVVADLTRQGFTTRRGTPLDLKQVQRISKRLRIA